MGAQSVQSLTLRERLEENDRLFQETGHLFGLRELRLKQEDPGTYEAIWHILLNIVNTGWAVGRRVSTSPLTREGGDAMWALHLPTGECVCTSRGITGHTGMLAALIRKLIELGYEEVPGIQPGEIFENNDPHYGGIHPIDFDSAVPIFYGDELVAWATAVTHVMDVGFILPGSTGFLNPDAFADGMHVSMEKVGAGDRFYPWYEMRIKSCTRMPDWVMSDARSRLAGMLTIRDRIIQLIDKYGLDYFKEATKEYIEDSRRYAARRIATQSIPGRLRKSNFKDLAMKGKRVVLPHQDRDFLFNVPLEMTITPQGKARFSLRGASALVPFGQNINPVAIVSALLNGYSHLVGFDMFNSGPVATWEIETPPPGSWANPYPVNYYASAGVAWAPIIIWLGSIYEAISRTYYARGYLEEVASGPARVVAPEFSGIGQYGLFVAGTNAEAAASGAPARAIADGENAAWCLYTPNGDQGNAEVMEMFYPYLYIGRNLEPDSGGYGKYRGGLSHTAVWLIKNTPGVDYQASCAGMSSKLPGNHGMFGAYPHYPLRGSYASGTNVRELIEARQPLVHERGDPVEPELAKRVKAAVLETNLTAPFMTPSQLHEYDLVVHPNPGGEPLGDPIERDPALVKYDLDNGWTRPWVAAEIYGVVASYDEESEEWKIDEAATERRRREIRETRKARGVPFRKWWEGERQRILAKEDMSEAVLEMWRSSLELSPDYGQELRAFWNLPPDFTF